MSLRFLPCLLTVCLTALTFGGLPAGQPLMADEFDDHSVYWLRKATESAEPLTALTMQDGLRLKPIGRRISSPCIVVKTDEDNWARALVTWGFRRSGDQQIPVLLIERYVTFRADRTNLTTAAGRDVMLFPGFGFNFDIGQVVPAGQGEDLICGEEGRLSPGPQSKLYGLNGSAVPAREPSTHPDPNSHEGVLPSDFAGRWQVRIDGRWEGLWQLESDGRRIYGKFISSDTQSVYEINGKVAALPHNAKLDIELANASQTIDAFLWTRDKSAMAGVVTMAERKIGFYALRLPPEESDAAPADAPEAKRSAPEKEVP